MMKMVSALFSLSAAPQKSSSAKTRRDDLLRTQFKGSPTTWSRQSLLLVSTALTLILLIADSALQDGWSFSVGSEFAFYLVGLCTAWVYLKFGGGLRKASKKGCSKGKQCDGARAAAGGPVARKSSGHREEKLEVQQASDSFATSLRGFWPGGDSGGGGPSPSRSHAMVRLHALLASICHEEGPEAAREQLLQIEAEADTCAYNIVIHAFAKRGDMASAEALLDRLLKSGRQQQQQADEQSFLPIILAACSKDVAALAESILRKMLDAGVEPSGAAYSAIIQTHAKAGSVRQGLQWIQHMKAAGVAPEPSCYNALIHACSVAGRSHEARSCLAAMKEDGVKPSVMTFTAMIDLSAKALDLKAAEAWMEEMQQLHIEPNVVSYSAMISACAKVGDLRRAEKWCSNMQERGIQPNAYSYSSLINACAKVGDVDAASAWLERAEQSGAAFDAVVYSCVINACARVGDAERAMAVFKKMRSHDILANVIIYSALARPFAYRGDWAQVEQIAEEMAADGVELNDYFLYTLILAYSRSKPREATRAERAFLKAMKGSHIVVNDRLKKVLASAVGYGRSMQLLQQVSC